jgi:hypothetical protein
MPTQLHSAPAGCCAFRAFRQTPAPEFCRLHGNWKHGQYAKDGVADRRMLRFCIQVFRGDLSHLFRAGFRKRRAAWLVSWFE